MGAVSVGPIPHRSPKIQTTRLYLIQANGKFPNVKTSLLWTDVNGALQTFVDCRVHAFETAVGDYMIELEVVVLGDSRRRFRRSLFLSVNV